MRIVASLRNVIPAKAGIAYRVATRWLRRVSPFGLWDERHFASSQEDRLSAATSFEKV